MPRMLRTVLAPELDRRQFLLGAAGCVDLACRPAVGDRASAIARVFERRYEKGLFAGEALVAQAGRVIYKGAFGLADRDAKRPYTTDTRSCLASLSKPITAAAIMMLADQSRLAYDNPLSTFLPGFSGAVGAATIRHLLTHTSGIPDYDGSQIDRPGVTNAEILATLQKVQRPLFPPGHKYQYCNAGYVLLSLIVEHISGESLPLFLAARMFKPLGMGKTFVLTNLSEKTTDVARGYERSGGADDFEGMDTGDSGVYSTVNDLLLFDQALYGSTLVRQETLAVAFTPGQVHEGSTTYGFGWNVVNEAAGVRVWHQGNTAGFRAFMERRLWNRVTVIMLTNGGDTDRMGLNDEIQRVLAV
jgi:CubicO group peptidase (beta-lactamase class C family)